MLPGQDFDIVNQKTVEDDTLNSTDLLETIEKELVTN